MRSVHSATLIFNPADRALGLCLRKPRTKHMAMNILKHIWIFKDIILVSTEGSGVPEQSPQADAVLPWQHLFPDVAQNLISSSPIWDKQSNLWVKICARVWTVELPQNYKLKKQKKIRCPKPNQVQFHVGQTYSESSLYICRGLNYRSPINSARR